MNQKTITVGELKASVMEKLATCSVYDLKWMYAQLHNMDEWPIVTNEPIVEKEYEMEEETEEVAV